MRRRQDHPAAEVVRRTLEAQPTRLVATVTGPTRLETVVSSVIQTLRPVLDVVPLVVVVLDNFEDNLTPRPGPGRERGRAVREEALAGFLAAWRPSREPAGCWSPAAARSAFRQREQYLVDRPLGPLTAADYDEWWECASIDRRRILPDRARGPVSQTKWMDEHFPP